MLILRPTRKRDLDDLVALAGQLDSMNLPSDRDFLESRIEMSLRSFAGGASQHGVYVFVLEDSEIDASDIEADLAEAAKEETALEGHILSLGQRNARERVTYLAVWLIDRAQSTCLADESNVLALPITQSQIADMLGLSLVHTNRTLRQLQREGLVEWKSRKIHVPDLAKAADFAQFDRSREKSRPFL